MPDLKLLALDSEDLEVISAFTQDAVMRVEDLGFSKDDHRFAALMNRFSWEDGDKSRSGVRKRAALRFEGVSDITSSGINLNSKDGVLELLTVSFEAAEAPAGAVVMTFAGGGEIKLNVECLEARLSDLGAAWSAKSTPAHD